MNEAQFCVLRRVFCSIVLSGTQRWKDELNPIHPPDSQEESLTDILNKRIMLKTLVARLEPTLQDTALLDCTILQHIESLTLSLLHTPSKKTYERVDILRACTRILLDTLQAHCDTMDMKCTESNLGDFTLDDFIQLSEKVYEQVRTTAQHAKIREKDLNGLFALLTERIWGVPHLYQYHYVGCHDIISSLPSQHQKPRMGISSDNRMNSHNKSKEALFDYTDTKLPSRKHLMWFVSDEQNTGEPPKLIGYHGVVVPSLDRELLPEFLRAFIYTEKEIMEYEHYFLPTQTALLKPYDLIWEVPGSPTGQSNLSHCMGIEGVVNASIELSFIPIELRQHILTSRLKRELLSSDTVVPTDSATRFMDEKNKTHKTMEGIVTHPMKKLMIEYVAVNNTELTFQNPSFLRSNDTYGEFLNPKETLDLTQGSKLCTMRNYLKGRNKCSSMESSVKFGTYPKHVWAGRKGAFTRDFASGPFRFTGLNR